MQVTVTKKILKLTPLNNITNENATEYKKKFVTAIEQKKAFTSAELCLSNLSMLDSAGISVIIGLYKTLQENDVHFSVTEVPKNIAIMFNLFKMNKFFPYQEKN